MKRIKESDNKQHWPRHKVKAVDCRKRDLVIRIADWTRDKDKPAYDVECYIGGVYNWNESKTFTFDTYVMAHGIYEYKTKAEAKAAAIAFAQTQVAKLL